ncbi:hypothetical protein BGZ46_008837 [Entomortierella lignicola]|nr:hypothetical protein BGZ46_008837 [Entomortierella lignicola]
MSEKELLAQIAQVAGAINKHMNSVTSYPSQRGGFSGRGRGRGRGIPVSPMGPFNRKLTLNNTASPPASPMSRSPTPSPAVTPAVKHSPIVKPFVRPPVPSRHLSLVNNNNNSTPGYPANVLQTKNSPTLASLPTAPTASSISNGVTSIPLTSKVSPAANTGNQQQWIQSKGKNMSMMNPASYKKTMEAKLKSIRSSKEKKLKLRQAQAKLASDRRKGIVTVGGKQYSKSRDGRKLVMRNSSQDNIVINGVTFEMDPRGNKLVRKSKEGVEPSTIEKSAVTTPMTGNTKATPKQFSMGGVVYVRTRNGNLVRATLVQKQLLEKRASQEALKAKQKRLVPKKPRAFCKFYTRFGQCSRGATCPFVHSRTHLAICKKFLRGKCPNNSNTCHLSHIPSPHTTPACSHFQRAACNKDNCLYPHIRINPQAPICRPFATEGWCETGINCKDRHVWICPDFGTPAGCKKKCGLAHVANGGIRVKRSAEEMEKERQEQAMEGSSTDPMSSVKRKRVDNVHFKSAGRYMDSSLDPIQNQDNQKDIIGVKRLQHDEDFVPFDLDDEEDAALLEQDENEVMGDFEADQEEDEEEDDDDVSSDEMDDDAAESEEDDEEDEEDDGDSTMGVDTDSEEDNDNYDDELERFYEEQDREDE